MAAPLAGTQDLPEESDRSARMVEGISRWLERETTRVAEDRGRAWEQREPKGWPEFRESRVGKLRSALGLERPSGANLAAPQSARKLVARPGIRESRDLSALAEVPAASGISVHHIQWPAVDGTHGEGLLLRPIDRIRALVIALPDADQPPESFGLAWQLAAQGCLVVVPTLVDRGDTWSGNDKLGRFTNQPHREWIYRQLFEVGGTVIGYEAGKVVAAIDAFTGDDPPFEIPAGKVGVVGYGEGGLVALHCAALDPRVAATLVSGHFGPRERLFEEPIYRNVFGLLREFGDAELAGLAAPRAVIVEHSTAPDVSGPPPVREKRAGAAPGAITTVAIAAVSAEVDRANRIRAAHASGEPVKLIKSEDGKPRVPGSEEASKAFLTALGVPPRDVSPPIKPVAVEEPARAADRQHRAVQELEAAAQRRIVDLERARNQTFWSQMKPGSWPGAQSELRARLEQEVIGKVPGPFLPPNPRTRIVRKTEKWTAYDVVLDVLPDVFAWGWLLVPKDLKPDERRPVVVCQHGLEGLPEHTVTDDPKSEAFGYYKAFAAKLAERGFVVFAPHNPYRGKDKFRMLQRRANPLGLSLFSFIVAQHDVATQWLATLPFVDPKRIGFYGLSYGGKTAMRVPALLPRYCLSICSGDFNEWIRKNVSVEEPINYPFTNEWEMPEWNLAAVANYAEMAMLIAPRPFMVERGHDDGVGYDEWVAYEYAKVQRGYVKLGIREKIAIEWFNGPHTINGVGTFEFLHKHLAWPAPPR